MRTLCCSLSFLYIVPLLRDCIGVNGFAALRDRGTLFYFRLLNLLLPASVPQNTLRMALRRCCFRLLGHFSAIQWPQTLSKAASPEEGPDLINALFIHALYSKNFQTALFSGLPTTVAWLVLTFKNTGETDFNSLVAILRKTCHKVDHLNAYM